MFTDGIGRIGKLRNYQLSPLQLVLLLVFFVVLCALAVVRFPTEQVSEFRWGSGAAAIVLAPSTVAVNAYGYRAQARLIRMSVPLREAFQTTLVGSAANLLPIPGAVVVRSAAMVDRGASVAQAGGATATGALAWLGLSLGIAVVPVWNVERQLLAVGLAFGCVAVLGVSALVAARLGSSAASWLLVLIASAGLVVALAVRYLLLVVALGFDPFGGALALVAVGALSSAAGFFPGGLGIREVLAGGAAVLVDLPAQLGVLVAAIDDIAYVVVTMVGLFCFAGGWSGLARFQRAARAEDATRSGGA